MQMCFEFKEFQVKSGIHETEWKICLKKKKKGLIKGHFEHIANKICLYILRNINWLSAKTSLYIRENIRLIANKRNI